MRGKGGNTEEKVTKRMAKKLKQIKRKVTKPDQSYSSKLLICDLRGFKVVELANSP